MVMWIALYVLFIGGEYRIAPLPIAFPSEKSCQQAVLQHNIVLEQSKPDEGSYMSRCVDMGKSV